MWISGGAFKKLLVANEMRAGIYRSGTAWEATVLEKTLADTAEIPARSDGNRAAIPVRAARADGRLWGARRTKQLTAEWVDRLGGPAAVDTVTLGRIKRAAELCAIAERARADALQDEGDGLDNLVRVERLADLALRRLGLDCKPPEPKPIVSTIGADNARCRNEDARRCLAEKLDGMAKRMRNEAFNSTYNV